MFVGLQKKCFYSQELYYTQIICRMGSYNCLLYFSHEKVGWTKGSAQMLHYYLSTHCPLTQ